MLNEAPNLNFLWASLIIEECVRNGVDYFSVAPGSRSAPLAWAVATGGPLEYGVHFDERGAAFQALGYARSVGRPAVFICSSGTALANAMPAVIEASYAQVPLLLITADRPPELQETGANQTIHQSEVYAPYTRWRFSIPCPSLDHAPENVLSTVDQAVHRAMTAPAGPVHLNCAFREPLAPITVDFNAATYTANLASWFDGPYTQYERPTIAPGATAIASIKSLLRQNRRGVILAGAMHAREDIAAVEAFAGNIQWPLLADIGSGLALGSSKANRVHHYDEVIRSSAVEALRDAQLILHFGAPMTSKAVLQLIADTPSRNYIHVAGHPLRQDPAHRVSHRIQASPAAFVNALDNGVGFNVEENWARLIVDTGNEVEAYLRENLDSQTTLSEHGVIRHVTRNAPDNSILYLGNSMPIRDADAFAASDGPRILVAANRGASGIDGNIATAAGYARALKRPVTAILGDLATLHDLNSLALLPKLRAPFVLIVLNNDGGGIFSFLPIAEHPKHFETFFGTPHGRSFQHAARLFDLEYARPESAQNFLTSYKAALENAKPSLIEIVGNRTDNESAHRQLRNAIQDHLRA